MGCMNNQPIQIGARLQCRTTREIFTVTHTAKNYVYYEGATAHGFVQTDFLHLEFIVSIN